MKRRLPFYPIVPRYIFPRMDIFGAAMIRFKEDMKNLFRTICFVQISLLIFSGCSDQSTTDLSIVSENVHAFYYPWYGNIEIDGGYFHWNHSVMGHVDEPHTYPGGDDIGANFYPRLGCYSSNDEKVVRLHMKQLKKAGIGVISVSWWGVDTFEAKAVPLLMDIGAQNGIKICFHIEPFNGRNAETTRETIMYLIDRYSSHSAFYYYPERDNLPLFYIYDSYLTSADEWATILGSEGDKTIRGTKYDALVIGLWVKEHEQDFISNGHFDGFYTYFATDGFTYGSTTANWRKQANWALENDKIFIPCVGPGYVDTRIRPWNAVNERSRERGAYFDRMFEAAIAVKPHFIGVTSFNEWHEGTQIEPAIPKAINGFKYEDYAPLQPDFYLNRARFWIGKFANNQK
ncbi:alpha-mannosidase [candidate division LCP-89 bacterium B3_LCP]|uniref:Alpha-mannosidase n=1 Tax=candidate division LCP-89 bacterium B3_LCP TaxID=2012998 RepID=A0A532USK3_UNCL8|nr:MAG: alpha-mannosidase [candidate division LCP-89 bacterium B3_LCP]